MKIEYCGPSTKYDKKYAIDEKSINVFDNACEKHDLTYKNKNSKTRNAINKKLYETVKSYFKEPYLSALDKINANIVKITMKLIKR